MGVVLVFDYANVSNTRPKQDRDKLMLGTAPKHRVERGNTMFGTEDTATEKRDVYTRVTSQIVNAIEQGVEPPVGRNEHGVFKIAL